MAEVNNVMSSCVLVIAFLLLSLCTRSELRCNFLFVFAQVWRWKWRLDDLPRWRSLIVALCTWTMRTYLLNLRSSWRRLNKDRWIMISLIDGFNYDLTSFGRLSFFFCPNGWLEVTDGGAVPVYDWDEESISLLFQHRKRWCSIKSTEQWCPWQIFAAQDGLNYGFAWKMTVFLYLRGVKSHR